MKTVKQNLPPAEPEIRRPKLVQIYQAPPPEKQPTPPPSKPDAGFASITMNNTVTREVLESLGGLRDTIRPIADSLTTHEMRPYEIQVDYRRQIENLRKEDQESVRASMSCLRGDNDQIYAPRPLYRRADGQEGIIDGINMIGRARLVSASPFRASIRLENEGINLNENSEDEDDDPF